MRRLTLIGLVLIALGVLGFVFPRITYTQDRASLDLGPVAVEAKKQRTITIPDVASGVAVVAGAALAIAGAGRRR